MNTDVPLGNNSDKVAEEEWPWLKDCRVDLLPAPPLVPTGTTIPAKPRWEFMDFRALSMAAEIMALNEQKHQQVNAGAEYSDGWKKLSYAKHFGSLMRHLTSWWTFVVSQGRFGEEYDPETKKPHLAHALCRIHFLLGKFLDEEASK